MLAAASVPGGNRHSKWTYVRADGSQVPALVNVSLLRDEQGKPTGFLAVATDLRERKALEEALHERTRQAEAASRAESAFLAHISHEFRTPLNAVIGLSQQLQQKSLPPDVGRFIGNIHDAGELLLALVSDVLDLSRIEAGEMLLEQVSFDLGALLQGVCALMQPQADVRGLALRLELPPALPAWVLGDPTRLRQMLLNLMRNAVKFTPSGRVTLCVRLLRQEPAHVTLAFEVKDTGIGVAPEMRSRIFEPFTQADASISRRFGGSGLGLSIVRRLVQLMNGALELQSTPGAGSTFSVTLTFEQPGEAGKA